MKNKKLLFHVCCAPCFVAPYFHLKDEFDLMGFWYNPNIHPYTEYAKRLEEVKKFERKEKCRIIYKDEYQLEKWLQNVVFRENRRCDYCYYDRLLNTAIYAKRGNFDYFTSTLLYSKFQQHEKIITIGNDLAKKYGVKFLSRDLREYWKEGIRLSKERNMYRQQYCGCIYSERERYYIKR
ncbi:MAG: epoxyqueuosine reductase QueH [Candidatus Cloacimonadota bacterium]|nr:epoxyqueuosine reductase QueH [Candidatus Cloacimonadota bacterium]